MNNSTITQLASDPRVAVKTLASALDLEVEREVADGLWRLGRFHGRMMYFAAEPNKDLKARLMNDCHAIFIYCQVGADSFDGFPASCTRRGRAFTEVIRPVAEGGWTQDEKVLDGLAPRRTAGIINGRRGNGEAAALRRVEWMRFMAYWYGNLRSEKNAFRPSWKKIQTWFHESACESVRRDRPSIRTLQRDVEVLTKPGKDEHLRSSDFTLLWEKMDDMRFVLNESLEFKLPDIVRTAFARLGCGCSADSVNPLPGGKNAYQEAC